MTVKELAALVKGSIFKGDGNRIVVGAAGLKDASDGDVSLLSNMRYLDAVYTTNAAAVFIQPDVSITKDVSAALIHVPRPDLAFAEILKIIADEMDQKDSGIDPSAHIGQHVKIAADAYIGPYVVIEDHSTIESRCSIGAGSYIGRYSYVGKNSFLHPHVVILKSVTIGTDAIIHSGCVIGSDGYGFATLKGKHHKIPQIGGVSIGDHVEIGSNVSIDRGTTENTSIGSGTKIDNLVHIAHNVTIGEDCLIVAQVGISGSTIIGNNVTLAGQVGVVGHITIGDNVVVAGKAGVIGNVPPNTVVSGFPARPHREAMKIQGYIQKLPELFKKLRGKGIK